MRHRLARWAIRILAPLVPPWRRSEWEEEWEAELQALEGAPPWEAADRPGPLTFVVGALPHALWTRMEGWTMESVLQDLRYAVRGLRRAPGFTLVAALTLTLGIGANGTVFSLVNGLVFRAPAGIHEPGGLVQIARSYDDDPRWDNWSWPALRLMVEEADALSGVAGYQTTGFVLGRGADTESVAGQLVTGSYFDVLGVRPFLGRLLGPSDDAVPGAHPVVVLSHGLWVRRFGSDPGVVGRTVRVGTEPYQVVGVAPPGFAGPETVGTPPALWVPTMQHPGSGGMLPFDQWGWSWLGAVGRRAAGVTFEEVRASMELVTARLRAAPVGDEAGVHDRIRVRVADGVGLSPEERAEARRISLLLLGIVGLVLLLTCLNVANLFLARGASRTSEVGVRRALGARRGRLVRQLVTESVVLAVLATVLAVPVVVGAGRLLPTVFPYATTVSLAPDGAVFVLLACVGLATGLLFGAAPAWASSRTDPADALRSGRPAGTRHGTRLRDTLVVLQLGLSLALVTGAALLGRSVLNARSADPGFDPDGLVVAFADLQPTGRYDAASGRELTRRLLTAVEAIPGVRSATVANQAPIAGSHARATVRPAGRTDIDFEAEHVLVGPGYFETLGIALVRGRPLGGLADEPERVVVVNEALAEMFWPGEDPLGRELERPDGRWRVVGVAGDVQMRSLRARAMPAVYYPLAHAWSSRLALHVRTGGSGAASARAVREAVAGVDPELPLLSVQDLREGLARSVGETRTLGLLVAAFAGLALVLAAVGLYGIMSFGVSTRVREMGIRTAVGARPGSLVRLVLARGLGLTAVGTALGLGLAVVVGRAFEGLLFGVPAWDPPTFGAAASVLVAVATLAAWIPARRAARVDVVTCLKE